MASASIPQRFLNMAWLPWGTKKSDTPKRFNAFGKNDSSSNISRTALPKPPCSVFSSTVITLPVFSAQVRINSRSRGFTNRAFMTAASIPSESSRSAASIALCTVEPMATMAKSFPGRSNSPFPISRDSEFIIERHADHVSSWIAHCSRTVVIDRRLQHMLKLVFILWGHNHHIGHGAQIRQVEQPVVRRSVFAHYPGAVHREDTTGRF